MMAMTGTTRMFWRAARHDCLHLLRHFEVDGDVVVSVVLLTEEGRRIDGSSERL
jgi:hypothetical protein